MTTSTASRIETSPQAGAGGQLVSTDGRTLPLKSAALRGDARGGLARVVLEQTFANPHDEPLVVTFSLALPADAAVSGFAFRFGEERVVGQVDARARARERFEQALLDGRTAALLEQERSSLFTQQVGNIPPRTEVVCEVQLDQPLGFLSEGAWEWRFPTVVAPRYLGGEGRVPDASRVSVDVAATPPPVTMTLHLTVRDALDEGARPESPSHALHTERLLGRVEVALAADAGAALDRDLVVRWRVAGLEPGVSLDVAERGGRRFALVTLVPPRPEARAPALPRDLVVLLDTSGSMSGEPLAQARRLTSALVDSLTDADQLELIEFSDQPRRWKRGAVAATASHRKAAQAWLTRLRASSSTEMRDGILEALAPCREGAQRQVVLITDGQIGFEDEVVAAVASQLPPGSRVHTVGVGSAVNRGLTRPVARAGRGVELVVGLGEDVEPLVARLLRRTVAPLLTGLQVAGPGVVAVAPARLPDVYAGTPAQFVVELAAGATAVEVRAEGVGGALVRMVAVPAPAGAGSQAVAALFGREQVEDLELARAAGADNVDAAVEKLGLEFQLSTRLTSWVAVSERPSVDPRAPIRREVMPQALPFGMSVEGLGLRGALGVVASAPMELMIGSTRLRGAFQAEPMNSPPMRGPSNMLKGQASGGGVKRRVLAARLVRSGADELLLEVTVEGGRLEWAPGNVVHLQLEGGTLVKVKVAVERTTAPGSYLPGVTLRLAVGSGGIEPEWVASVLVSGPVPLRLVVKSE